MLYSAPGRGLDMTIVQSINRGLSHMTTFSGRASRSEYGWYVLFLLLLMYAVSVVLGFGYGLTASVNLNNPDVHSQPGYWLGLAFDAFILATTLAAGARRLHDTGRSGWWLLLHFTVIGSLLLIFWWCLPGNKGDNAYGSDPLAGEA